MVADGDRRRIALRRIDEARHAERLQQERAVAAERQHVRVGGRATSLRCSSLTQRTPVIASPSGRPAIRSPFPSGTCTPRSAAMRASSCVKRCASPDSSVDREDAAGELVAARRERGLDRDAFVRRSSRRGRSRTCASARPTRRRARIPSGPCRTDRMPRSRWSYSMPVCARSSFRQSREYSARLRHWIVLCRVRDGRHS